MGWTTYKGLTVPESPTGDAGINLKDNFTTLADQDGIGGTVHGGTSGSVLFVDQSQDLAQDNGNLHWDDSNNRLGLGTSSPLKRLQVEGDGEGLLLATGQPGFQKTTVIEFGSGAATDSWMRVEYAYSSSNLSFQRYRNSVWSTVLLLDWDDGYVGIGTDSPENMLHVVTDDAHCLIEAETTDASNYTALVLKNTSREWWVFHSQANQSLSFWNDKGTGGTTVMALDEDGYVGIGKNSPTATLHVDGTIIFENLPTSDPSNPGQLWVDSGVLKVSS